MKHATSISEANDSDLKESCYRRGKDCTEETMWFPFSTNFRLSVLVILKRYSRLPWGGGWLWGDVTSACTKETIQKCDGWATNYVLYVLVSQPILASGCTEALHVIRCSNRRSHCTSYVASSASGTVPWSYRCGTSRCTWDTPSVHWGRRPRELETATLQVVAMACQMSVASWVTLCIKENGYLERADPRTRDASRKLKVSPNRDILA